MCYARSREMHPLKDAEDHIDFILSSPDRISLNHRYDHVTCGPDIHHRRVLLLVEQNLGSSVPQSHHLMCQRSDRKREGPSETEVAQLQHLVFPNEDVLRLQIAVHDSNAVNIVKGEQQLVGKGLRQHSLIIPLLLPQLACLLFSGAPRYRR